MRWKSADSILFREKKKVYKIVRNDVILKNMFIHRTILEKYRVEYFIRSFKILLMSVILFPFHLPVTYLLAFMVSLAPRYLRTSENIIFANAFRHPAQNFCTVLMECII